MARTSSGIRSFVEPYSPPLEDYRPKPHSARMQALLQRALLAIDHTLSIGPGHDFQTAISLANRGEAKVVFYGEPPKQWSVMALTDHGLARARAYAAPPPPPPPEPPPWPFAFSSRGWHLPVAQQATAAQARAPVAPRKAKGRG